jgi:hypothetical protein
MLLNQSKEEVTGLKDIADDIKNMHSHNRSLKEQNTRLMTVNEKLLDESESLRKEIYRLRALFGQENYLSTNKQHKPEQGGKDSYDSRITELMIEIKSLGSQKQIVLNELDNVNRERANLMKKFQEMQQDVTLLRNENTRLQEAMRIQTGPNCQIESLLRQQATERASFEDFKTRARSTEDQLDQQMAKLVIVSQERDRLAGDRNSLLQERDRLAQQLRSQTQTPGAQSAQTLEVERLSMALTQVERERDLAKRRLAETEADVNAQLEKVAALERQVADLRLKALQTSTPQGQSQGPAGEQLAGVQRVLAATQADLDSARKELDTLRKELNSERSMYRINETKEADSRKLETSGYLKKIQDLQDDLQSMRVANTQLQDALRSQSGSSTQIESLLRKQAADKVIIEETMARARISEEKLAIETSKFASQNQEMQRILTDFDIFRGQHVALSQERDRLAGDRNSLLQERDRLAQQLRSQTQTPGAQSAQTLEVERLSMALTQVERERDLAKRRLAETEADVNAQLEKVAALERQVADLRLKALQTSTPQGQSQGPAGEQLAGVQRVLAATQADLDSARKELDDVRKEKKELEHKEIDTRMREIPSLLKKIQDLQDELRSSTVANTQLQDALRSQSGSSSQIDSLLRQQATERASFEDFKTRARSTEDQLDQQMAKLVIVSQERDRLAGDRNSLLQERDRLAQQLRSQTQTPGAQSAQTLEVERLSMALTQVERERDLAKRRLAETEADVNAQLEKVAALERQVADLRLKALQTSTPQGQSQGPAGEQLAGVQRVLAATQADLDSARKELDGVKMERDSLKIQKKTFEDKQLESDKIIIEQVTKTKTILDDLGLSKQELDYFKSKSDKLQQENNKLIDQISQFVSTPGLPGNVSSSVLTFGGLQQSSLIKPEDGSATKLMDDEIINLRRQVMAKDFEIRDLKDSHSKEVQNFLNTINEMQTENQVLKTENQKLKSGSAQPSTILQTTTISSDGNMKELKDENEGMKKLIDQLNKEIDYLNKELKTMSSKVQGEKGQNPTLSPQSLDNQSNELPLSEDNQKLKAELQKQVEVNSKNQILIEELNDHIGSMTAQLAKQQRLSTLSTADVQIINENRDLKEQVEKLKGDLGRSDRQMTRLRDELEETKQTLNQQSPSNLSPMKSPENTNVNEEVISQLNKTITTLNTELSKKDAQIGDLEAKLKTKIQSAAPQQTEVKTIKPSDVEKIKAIIQSQNPGEDVKVSVILDAFQNYQIDIEKSAKDNASLKPGDSAGSPEQVEKQRIKIPSHLFDQFKEVKIESNTDASGKVIPQTIFSQSFVEGMKVTEVISKPSDGSSIFESQVSQPPKTTSLDRETAAFFDLLMAGDQRLADVAAHVKKAFVQPSAGKESALIQALIAAKIQVEPPKESPTVISVSTFDKDGKPVDKHLAVVDTDGLKKDQENLKQSIVNDLILVISKSGVSVLGDAKQSKEGEVSIFREVPNKESVAEGSQIDRLIMPLINPQDSEVIQRVIVKDVTVPTNKTGQDNIEATVQIETVNQEGKLSIAEFRYSKKADGSVSLLPISEPRLSLASNQKLEKPTSESISKELEKIAQLIKSTPPAIETKPGQPLIIRPTDSTLLIEKIGQSKPQDIGNMIKSAIGTGSLQSSQVQPPRIQSQVLERVIIDPADLSRQQSNLSVLKEDFSQNPKNSSVTKVEIDEKGNLSSQLLGTKNSQRPENSQDPRSSSLENLKDMNLSKLAQQEAIPALLMSKDQTLAVDSDLSQLLPFILPEEMEGSQSSYNIRTVKDNNDLVYEVYSVITPAGPGESQTGVGLVKQRTRIVDSSKSANKWKIVRETISPTGNIQKEEFEVDKVTKADLLKRGFVRPEAKNKTSFRTYRDPKIVKSDEGKQKGLDIFEISPQAMSWITKIESPTTTGKQIIIHDETGQTQQISKLQIPIENKSICELVEKVIMNKQSGQGVHTLIGVNGVMIEEFIEGKTPGESVIVNRIAIGPSQNIQENQNSLMHRSLAPQDSDVLTFKEESGIHPRLQTIIRDSLVTQEQSQIIVPVEQNFDLTLPSCLGNVSIIVKNRNFERESELASAAKLQTLISKNKCLQLIGSIDQIFTFIEPEITTNQKKNFFHVANVKSDGISIEKFEVGHQQGSLSENLKLLSKINLKCPSYTSRIENIEISKEVPQSDQSLMKLSYRLNKSEGPQEKIMKELSDSELQIRNLGTVSLLPKGLEPHFLKLLFSTHEFGSQYVLLADGDAKIQEWLKIEVPTKKSTNANVKESWVIQSTKPEVVTVQRTILEINSTVIEDLVIEKTSSLVSPPADKSKPQKNATLHAIPSLMKLKKKIKTIKASEGNLKLQENPLEDGVDCLRKQQLSTELKDLLELVYPKEEQNTQSRHSQRQLMFFNTNDQKAVLKTLSYTAKSNTLQKGPAIQDPKVIREAEIIKTISIKPFASLVAHKMIDEDLMDAQDIMIQENRDSYISISKLVVDPSEMSIKKEKFEVSINPQTHGENIVKVEEKNNPIDRLNQTQETGFLKRYFDFICSLLKAPENLMKPNSILTQKIHGDQVIIRRADLLKDNNSQDSAGINLFVREELLFDKCLLEAFSFTGSDNQGSTNFNTANAAKLIENKLKEYSSSKAPGMVEKLWVRRSSLHEGSLAVDTIKVDVKDGQFENSIQERKIHELNQVEADEQIGDQTINSSLVIALKSIIKDRHRFGNTSKTIGLIEEDERGEVGVSQIQVGLLPEIKQKDPLSYSVEDYGLNKIKKITFDATSYKFNGILGKESPLDAKSESIVSGGKVQIDTVKINPDLTQSKLESVILPRLPDWETQLNLIQLEAAFRGAGAVSSKPECFIQRRVEDDQIIYNIVQFEEKAGDCHMKILEQFSIPKKEESINDKLDRPTIKFSDDYFYNRITSPEKKREEDMQRSLVQPGQINIRGEPGSRQGEPMGNVFQSMGFDNPLTMIIDDDDSIIEKKSIRPMMNRSSLLPSKKTANTRPIMTPLVAVLRSIDNLNLLPDALKDTVMVQKEENSKCVFELLKIRIDPLSGNKTFEPIIRVITPLEKTVFDPMEITRETLKENTFSKVVDQLRVTPDGDITRLSTREEVYNPSTTTRHHSDMIGVEDVIANLSNFVKIIRQEPFYVKVLDNSPTKLTVETIEIVDKFKELMREKIDIQRDSAKRKEDSVVFTIVRTVATPDGQIQENLEYQKAIQEPRSPPSTSVTVGKTLVSVLSAKSTADNPIKPYKNVGKERAQAEIHGVAPTVSSKPIDIEQIIELIAKETGQEAFILSQTVDKDKKIINKYRIKGGNQPPELVEKFTLDLKQMDDIIKGSGRVKADEPILDSFSLPKYFIRGEKSPEGQMIVKVFRVVEQKDQNKVSSLMAKPFTDEEKKTWKVIVTSFDDQTTKLPLESSEIRQPIALLELQEISFGPTGQIISKNNILGDVVGVTKDGDTIYQNQVDPNIIKKMLPLAQGGEIKVQPSDPAYKQSRQDVNMFGSMVNESTPNIPFNADASQIQQNQGGLNAFGSMTDLGSEAGDNRGRNSIVPNPGMQQGYTFVVHPAPEQATPQQLAKYYIGQIANQTLSSNEKSRILDDLLRKMQAAVDIEEADTIRRELEEKDRQITVLASSNATADFGNVLSTKDSELKKLRDDKKSLQEQVAELSELITTLRTKIVIQGESVAPSKLDSSLDQELEILVQDMRKKGVITESAKSDITLTSVNKANLKDCIMATWKVLVERDRAPQTPSLKSNFNNEDFVIIQGLKEENSELKHSIEKSDQDKKTLKDKITELEMEKIKSMSYTNPNKSAEGTGQQTVEPYLTKTIMNILDIMKDKGIIGVKTSSSGDLILLERALVKDLITAGEQTLKRLEDTEAQSKDFQVEVNVLKNKLKLAADSSQTELTRTIDNLERELNKQKSLTTNAEASSSQQQQENTRLKNELENYKMNATRELALIDNDLASNNRELEKLRDNVKNLRAEVDDKDKKILSLMSVQVKTPGADQEKEYLKDQIAKLKRNGEVTEEENRKLEIQIQDMRGQLKNSEFRCQQIENNKNQEITSLQRVIEGFKSESSSIIKLQPVTSGQDFNVELEKIREDNKNLAKYIKELETRLGEAVRKEEKEHDLNRDLKDKINVLELKVVEISSPQSKNLTAEKNISSDPLLTKMIDETFTTVQSIISLTPRAGSDQVVGISSKKIENLNQSVVKLLQVLKEEQEKHKDTEHKLKLALQNLETNVAQQGKKDAEFAFKIENLGKDLDLSNKQYKEAMSALQSLQNQPLTPEKISRPSPQVSESKAELEKVRDDLKTAKDRVAALETEVSVLKGKEALISSPKKDVSPSRLKVDDRFDSVLKEAKEAGYESFSATSSEDVEVKEWMANSAVKIIRLLLADKKKVLDESLALSKDLISANDRIASLQKSLIAEGDKYRGKVEEKDNEIYKLNSDLTKLADSIKEQQAGTNPEKEKNLEQMMKLKDSELGRLRAESENLRETMKDLKDKNNSLELQLIESIQQKELIRSEILKLTKSQPDEVPKDQKEYLEALFRSLKEKGIVEKPGESDLQYKISVTEYSSMVKAINGLLDKLSVKPPPEPKPDNQLIEATSELALLKTLLNEQKDAREKDKKDREKRETDWKRKEDEFMRQLEKSVSLDSMNEKVGRLKTELEEKKNIISGLERETKTLKAEIKSKETDVVNLDKEISEKSQKLIELDSLKTKIKEVEDEKKRIEEKDRKEKEILEEEIKKLKVRAISKE